ncbi:transcriptional regulator [Pedobacter lusitanus]|uniref:Transcriptional regulator n=1 Tax=Pedobacter lusitanus TaxID=1503925 RepID=A0A0D0GVM5_9SPHI|nr:GyrI-like domain-containing protein [Pedobacter lusitanus]KIO78481.1 transcriptional regulator [Pedobacter lusitanus]
MTQTELQGVQLIGISTKEKTTNENDQASIDCGNLWQEFMSNGIAARIPGKLSDEILAAYHSYDGDYTNPYAFFIGCKVSQGTVVPEGLDSLVIPSGNYLKITAKGKFPECIANTWREIWRTDYPRAYTVDFEVYDERSADWNNSEVDIFLSVK